MTSRPAAPQRPPGGSLPRALREFIHTEAAGGVVVLVGALVALAWANSPWHAAYTSLWHTEVNIEIGPLVFAEDLRELVNEALMAIFFFVVGLEVKRELVVGELRSWRRASLPAIGAVGGMVVPALLYLALAGAGPGRDGWGIPMATDIAFAVGVVALLGPRVPSPLKLFLLTLAVVDDLGAIVVIAIFYSAGISLGYLASALAVAAGVVVARAARLNWPPLYVGLGVLIWYLTYRSGVHATIAGALFGLLTPARPRSGRELAHGWADDLAEEPTPETLAALTRLANHSLSVAERMGHKLHPWTIFGIVPLFALANAGVRIEADSLGAPGATSVILGVSIGLVLGKPLGITLFAWLAVRTGIGSLPTGVSWPQLASIAAVAGIGFTVSLFIAGLAFSGPELEAAAKVGIVAASTIASVAGALWLRSVCAPPRRDRETSAVEP